MERIKLHDKYFRLCMPAAQIDEAITQVADKINADMKEVDTPIFLSVLNGSFMFTADLMRKIKIQSDVVFIKLASYDGTSTTGSVKQIMGLTKSVKGRTVVVVEDIVDTGGTIEELHKILQAEGVKDIRICTLLFKPDSYKKDIKIDYPALVIPIRIFKLTSLAIEFSGPTYLLLKISKAKFALPKSIQNSKILQLSFLVAPLKFRAQHLTKAAKATASQEIFLRTSSRITLQRMLQYRHPLFCNPLVVWLGMTALLISTRVIAKLA